jgi:hypothetical protein
MRAFILTIVLMLVPVKGAALTVTLIDWDPGGSPQTTTLSSHAISIAAGGQNLVAEPGSVPFLDTDRAVKGNAVAESQYTLTNAALAVEFSDHSHTFGGASAISSGAIYFTINQNVEYSIEGAYTFQSGDAHEMELRTTLVALDGSGTLFENEQHSSTASETFRLGEIRGNRDNVLSGSLTGALNANTPYRWTYWASTYNPSPSAQPGNASGFTTLTFVPEPSTALLLAMGLAALGLLRGKRRSSC